MAQRLKCFLDFKDLFLFNLKLGESNPNPSFFFFIFLFYSLRYETLIDLANLCLGYEILKKYLYLFIIYNFHILWLH